MEILTFGKSGSRPYGQLIIDEISVSPNLNQSTVSIKLVLKRPYAIVSAVKKSATCTVSGKTYNWVGTIGGVGDKVLISTTQIIPHENDGSKTIFVSASIKLDITWSGVWVGSIQGIEPMTLTKIPRGAIVSQSLAMRTDTSLTINWSADKNVDRLWFSSNNGSSWTERIISARKWGSYTIENLSVGGIYNVKTRVRNADSQVISESSVMVVSTYDYPHAIFTPNFTIGDPVIITIENPMSYTVTVELLDNNDRSVKTYSTSGAAITGFNELDVQSALYQSIPNSRTGMYKIRVTYGSHSTTDIGGMYSINEERCLPTIDSVSYQDVNQTVVAITQNNQKILKGHSVVQYTISGISALNYATISSCSVFVNGNDYNLTLSGNSATGGNATLNSGSNVSAVFTVVDSRGLRRKIRKTISVLDYQPPTATIDLKRKSNFYTDTDITVNANYSSINGHNAITITYRAKKTSSSQYTVTGTLQNNVLSTILLDNNYWWEIETTLTDSVGGTQTYTNKVAKGVPLFFIDKQKYSVGINCFPKNPKTLEINGINVLPFAAMCLNLSSDILQPQTGSFQTLNFNRSITTNDSIFDTTTNSSGIKVVSTLENILVSATVKCFFGPTAGERMIRILCIKSDNNRTYYGESGSSISSNYDTLHITPVIVKVDQGSEIFLEYKLVGSLDSIKGGGTWFTASST